MTRLARRFTGWGTVIAALAAGAIGHAAPDSPASLYAGLTWRCLGPFDGGPVSAVAGIAGVPGVYTIDTTGGGIWRTIDGGQTWTSAEGERVPTPADGDPRRWIDPANANRIVSAEAHGISVSLNAGQTWTAFHNQPIASIERLATTVGSPYWVLATEADGHLVAVPSRSAFAAASPPPVSARFGPDEAPPNPPSIDGHPVHVVRADPARAGLVFAGTDGGVYVSFDTGIRWTSLRLNLPSVPVSNLLIHGDDLIAATRGRSIWVMEDISPLRQMGAAAARAAVVLFAPAPAVRLPRESARDAAIDYYVRAAPAGTVTLEILDALGRRVHRSSSAAAARPDAGDPWVRVAAPLAATAGGHRVRWNLRHDPPPASAHRYARLASALADDAPADPDGPLVLPGLYRVRLTVNGVPFTQLLRVRNDPRAGMTPAATRALQRQFDRAFSLYEAMKTAHAGFMQVARLRTALAPLLDATDPDLAQMAADLEARLSDLDGSDWTGPALPDADSADADWIFDKDTDESPKLPPAPVPLSKDYDDPTTIIGRLYENVHHVPAFAIVSAKMGQLLMRTDAAGTAPRPADTADYRRSCRELNGVLAAWRSITAYDVPQLNAELARRKLPRLPAIGSTPAARRCR